MGEEKPAASATGELFRLLAPVSPRRLSIPEVRYLGRINVAFRWGGGLGVVALVGILNPPKQPFLLALLVIWVAAYNGPTALALNRLDNDSIRTIVRAATIIDMLSYFGLLAIFLGRVPPVLIAVYPAVLIEAVSFDGAVGAIYGIVIFVLGFSAVQIAQGHFSSPDTVLWSAVMAVTATSVTLVTQVMLGGRSAEVPKLATEPGAPPAAAATPRLSVREREVLRLVAEGYSNAMIASRLHLSENTIKGHVESLLTRLNARNRAEAVAAAGRLDLL